MCQIMLSIIAVSKRIGRPVIFLTMTCSLNWPELKATLLPRQNSPSRPDIAAKVFRVKLQTLLAFVTDEETFSDEIVHIQVIEFQKMVVQMRVVYAFSRGSQ